jgi:four helix bundle protein
MQESVESWRKLEVWRYAHQLVLRVYELTRCFPTEEKYRLVDQLCRAASSIPTNIAEGKGRSSTKEYLHFLAIARGSIEEVKYLLLLSHDLGYTSETLYFEISNEYDRVGRMLNGLIRSLKQRTALSTQPPTPDP